MVERKHATWAELRNAVISHSRGNYYAFGTRLASGEIKLTLSTYDADGFAHIVNQSYLPSLSKAQASADLWLANA